MSFLPEVVRKWRLIGYENRAVADKDFRDDSLDFGEPGFARDVTALYELRLQEGAGDNDEVGRVYLRWVDAGSGQVMEVNDGVKVSEVSATTSEASAHLRRSAAVAEFAELARRSFWARCSSLLQVAETISDVKVGDGMTKLLLKLLRNERATLSPTARVEKRKPAAGLPAAGRLGANRG